MLLPLATYTAEHGLEWHYDKPSIDFAKLDQCRHLLGSLPDFDSGEVGYNGVAAIGDHVFAIRCAKAKAWDFKGRDSLYMTVTWVSREEAQDIDFGTLLKSQGMCAQTHEYKFSFETECHRGGVTQGKPKWQTGIESGDDVFVRWDLQGGEPSVRIIRKKGQGNMTEAEKVLFGGDESAESSNAAVGQQEKPPETATKAGDAHSIPARILGVIAFIVLIMIAMYLARMTSHVLVGYIVGAAAFAALGTLWKIGK